MAFYGYTLGDKIAAEETIEGHCFSKKIINKGYKAYLILRRRCKNNPILRKNIREYKKHQTIYVTDDQAGFFS